MRRMVTDVVINVTPADFPGHEIFVEKIIERLRFIYRNNALMAMSRYSRGSVLIQSASVYTTSMLDEILVGG